MKSGNHHFLIIIGITALAVALACSTVVDIFNPPTSTPHPSSTTIPPTSTTQVPTATDIPNTSTPTPTEILIEPSETPAAKIELLHQWATGAEASSEYSTPAWSAEQALGEPDTELIGEMCSDEPSAWASQDQDSVEWIELRYEVPVYPVEINIIQTYSPDQVSMVEVIDLDNEYYTVYESQPTDQGSDDCPYELSAPVSGVDTLIYGVRITIDQTQLESWNEIDAVELVGIPQDSAPGTGIGEGEIIPHGGTIDGIPSADKAPEGGFYYRVFNPGFDETIISINYVDQSTDDEIVVDLISINGEYTLTLFISPELVPDFIVMESYQESATLHAPSAILETERGVYFLDYGTYEIERVVGDEISGNFFMAMQSDVNPDEYISVEGAFNGLQVELP